MASWSRGISRLTGVLSNIISGKLLVVLITVFAFGILYLAYDFGYDRAVSKMQKQAQLMISEVEKDWRKKYLDGVKKAEELQIKLDAIGKKTQVIKEQVKVYVAPEKDQFCDPSVGVVRLLNDAKNSKLPEAAVDVTAESGTAAGVGYSGLVIHQIDNIEAYNRLMERHNQLIKWIEANYE